MTVIDNRMSRRSLVRVLAAGAALGIAGPVRAAGLMETPAQTKGPFYPVQIPLDHDNDLVQVAGHVRQAAGEVVHLFGRVLDTSGNPIADAKVEIWQCDSNGHYHHPDDSSGPADPDFQGYGETESRFDGAWRFRTIKPVPYSSRAPHIHFMVSVPGLPRLTTQMYLKNNPRNKGDFLYRSLKSDRERDSVSVDLLPAPKIAPGALAGKFDIIIGGNTSAG